MGELLIVIKRISDNAVMSYETRGGTVPTDEEFQAGAAANFGGVAADYAIVRSTDPAIITRVMRGDDFTLGANNVFSFAASDAKRFLIASVNKTEVLDDGVDFALITLQARNTNAQGNVGSLATGVNATINVFVEAPWGTVRVPVTFQNGVATKRLVRRDVRDEGMWRIPSGAISPLYKTRPVGTVEVEIMSSIEDNV